jgi:purine-binding chemotaxis protein CheW
VLVVTGGGRSWALPLLGLRETMRALPLEPLQGAPEWLLGLSVIRGAAVPVIDLCALLGGTTGLSRRYVTLRSGERDVALAVTEVRGVLELESEELAALPTLVESSSSGAIEAVGLTDAGLLPVLNTTRLVPSELWDRLRASGAEP